jgi:glyoxalase family protein
MITGIHHITAIAGDPQENLDFYAGVMGMRLVKRSVNQDDPSTYHLFYADADGRPGTDLTFFPMVGSAPARLGHGLGVEIALAIPVDAADYWEARLRDAGVEVLGRDTRRGETSVRFVDPHGQSMALVATADAREHSPWHRSAVPAERQILGLHAVRLWERDVESTGAFLTATLGLSDFGEVDGWHRFGVDGGGSGKHVEIQARPEMSRGAWGQGSMHHVAWRVADDRELREVRHRVDQAKRRPTDVIDRFWFKSVYFLEPGGVLFELATDGPGFTADESPDALGERLVLPPWLESERAAIEDRLPPLTLPAP